nr:immunoglobulin heavy chain junction region [Mus musculus]
CARSYYDYDGFDYW